MHAKLKTVKKYAYTLAKKPTARKAAGLMALMYLSPAVGLLLDNILARSFGVGSTLDIFRLVTTFMLLGVGLVAGTLLKYAIIPELAKAKAANDIRGGLMFVLILVLLVFALMLPMIITGIFAPQWMLHFLGPGLPITPEAYTLIQVATLGFAFMILLSAGGAVLQFYGSFWAQPMGQLALNLGLMLVVLVFAVNVTTPAAQLKILTCGLALGIFGYVMIFCFLLAKLWRKNLRAEILGQSSHSSNNTWASMLKVAFLALVPQMLIMGSEIIKNIATNRALSYAEPGSLALFTFVAKLLMMVSLPVIAITTILFPQDAKDHATGLQAAQQTIKQLNHLFIVTMVIACGLFLLAPFVLYILFGLAQLTQKDFEALTTAFRILIWLAPASAVSLYITNQYYARHLRGRILIFYVLHIGTICAFISTGWANHLYTLCGLLVGCQILFTLLLWAHWYLESKRV